MHIHDIIEENAHDNAGYAIAYALLQLADAHRSAAIALRNLGTGNAATEMGVVEMLAGEVGRIAEALRHIVDKMPEDDS
jgi:hypothetical protein